MVDDIADPDTYRFLLIVYVSQRVLRYVEHDSLRCNCRRCSVVKRGGDVVHTATQ